MLRLRKIVPALFLWSMLPAGTSVLCAKVPEQAAVKDSVILFRFVKARKMFWRDYRHNNSAIHRAARMIRQHLKAIKRGDAIVTVHGYCESFKTTYANLKMAKNRSNQVKTYYITHLGMKERYYRTKNHAYAYQGDRNVVAMLTVDFLKKTQPSPAHPKPVVTMDTTAVDTVQAASQPERGTAVQDTARVQSQQPAQPNVQPSVSDGGGRYWTLKTNLPYWGLGVPNAAVEYRFADHWSVDVPVFYQPVTIARAYRFRTFAVQPSLRYHLTAEPKGHFFGFHLTAGMFNIAVDHKTRYQDNGGMYGAGLDYGYAFLFGRHWGLELNLGAGYIYTKYDKFYNIKNGALFETDTKHYWGITKFGVSLTYLLNNRRK